MNELIFFTHLFAVIGLILIALRLGKEALIACFSIQVVIANLFVIKQAPLFGFHVTCCDVFIIGSMLSLQCLQEFYGRDTAKKTIWIGFFSMLFFGIMATIHLSYQPSAFDTTQAAYKTVLSQTPRLFLASFATFYCCQRLDIFIFGRVRQRWPDSSFFIRSGCVLIPMQILDTILFSFLGLWGLMANLTAIMCVSLFVKLIIIFSMTPLTMLAKRAVKT